MKYLLILFTLLSWHLEAQDKKTPIKKEVIEKAPIKNDTIRKLQIYQPPRHLEVSAGDDQTIKWPKDEALLKGYVKADKKDTLSYQWSMISGPGKVDMLTPSEKNTKVTHLVEGVYLFALAVNDNRKAFGVDTVMVTMKGGTKNHPPVAFAGPDLTIDLPSIPELSGEGKDPDPNGSITSYYWTQIAGPTASIIDDPKSQKTPVHNLVTGIYKFLLRVTDETYEAYGWDTVNVIVNRHKNHPPTAEAGEEITIELPVNKTTLSGFGKDPDPDATLSYLWTQIKGPTTSIIVTPTHQKTQVTNLIKGVYQFELVVMDNFEAKGSDKVIVNVYPIPPPTDKNIPPTAKAGGNKTITLPENNITLDGSGSDADGKIIKYAWTQILGQPSAQISDASIQQPVVTFLVAGKYQFELEVTDNKDATGTDIAEILVIDTLPAEIPQPPIANAGTDITITLPEDSVTLTGSGTDPNVNGKITRFVWSKDLTTLSGIIENPSDSITLFSNLEEGIYKIKLIVINNKGIQGEDTVTITVKNKSGNAILPIILTFLGLVGLVSSFYFFFWLPLNTKVMVFFMHPDEEALAHKLLQDSDKTEGFSVSHTNRSTIRKLRKNGLAVHLLNTTHLVINTPGKTSSFQYSYKKDQAKLKSEKTEPKPGIQIKNLVAGETLLHKTLFPSFYIITLDAPLLPKFQEKLEALGTRIIQRVPENSYIIHVEDPEQLEQLRSPAFRFIRLINYYSAVDTGMMVREDHYIQAVREDHAIILDLFLHREEDSAQVLQELKQRSIEVLGAYRNRIRITLSARSVLDHNLSGNIFIQAIYEYIPPVLHNDIARQIIGIDAEDSGQSKIAETGAGQIIGVADTGIDRDHPDIKSRILEAVSWGRKSTNDTSDPDGHGTHVTGSIIGDGTSSGGKIKGMAPGAKVFFQSIMDDTGAIAGFEMKLQELFLEAYNKGARIHNNSWGSAAEARYTLETIVVDEFMYEHPEMLIVISAGNEGACNTTVANEKGYVGFGSVGSPATSKNGLTVGASRSKRKIGGYASATYGKIWPQKFSDPPTSQELISGDPKSIAAFSSRGRCDDYRMKPDIVAPGTDILSVRSGLAPLNRYHGGYAEYHDAYAFLGGTSMAAPIVAGAAALVREFYKNKKDYATPSAALVKATLINGTFKLDGQSATHGKSELPNPNQGYGRLDLMFTIPNDQNPFHLEFRDSLKDNAVVLNTTGQEYKLKMTTKQVGWIRVCMAYTDFPDRSIQNDLDLMMDYEPTRQKWSGNLGINAQDPLGGRVEDSTNNMEIIRIDNAQPGLYTVMVVAHNLTKGKQGFALVVTTSDQSVSFE